MIRFRVFEDGRPAKSVDLAGAYMFGNDRVPLRVELTCEDGEIRCDPRGRGAAALAIVWPVEGIGRIMLETTRLVERPQPYNLHVELARGQLMRIAQKREDWGLYDFTEGRSLYEAVDAARDLLIDAVTAPDDVSAAAHGDAAIAAGVKIGEAVGRFHGEIFLKRRQAGSQIGKRPLGCRLAAPEAPSERVRGLVAGAFNFVSVPFPWGVLEPKEGKYRTAALDQTLRALRQSKIPVRGCSLLSLQKALLPPWLLGMSRDFERIRGCVTKHLKYLLEQFGDRVRGWEVISGVHAQTAFGLTFEQIMELTRMSAILAKQMAPRSSTIVGIVQPWGEYYAEDPRTIPPLLYAEMVVQSGVNFDAFGLEMRFGNGASGRAVRDLMQISAMLDRYGSLSKPVHVTAAGVPSGGPASGGAWHGDTWTEDVQAEWIRDFYQIALSKPFVESVCWQALADAPDGSDSGGVLRSDLSSKPGYEEILAVRRGLRSGQTTQGSVGLSRDDGLEA